MLRRSFYTALVVGTLLTTINQGNLLLSGTFPSALAWKVPLTYCVPFCVATWGALINSRAHTTHVAATEADQFALDATDAAGLTPTES